MLEFRVGLGWARVEPSPRKQMTLHPQSEYYQDPP